MIRRYEPPDFQRNKTNGCFLLAYLVSSFAQNLGDCLFSRARILCLEINGTNISYVVAVNIPERTIIEAMGRC